MEDDDRAIDGAALRENPEEAAHAIAIALEFLRVEAVAIGLYNVGVLIGLARARMCDHFAPRGRAPDDH